MIKIGIDPGITGAIAVIRADGSIGAWDMPIMTKVSGKGSEVNAAGVADILREITAMPESVQAYLERVGAMPGQGSTSMFSFGKSAGKVEGVLATLSIPFMQPTPQSWKRRAGALKKEKDFTRTLAIQLYPAYAELFERKKDVGRADAVLIARYGE